MKRAISLFMSIAMLVSAVLCVDLSAFASELSINNRAAWLSTLVSTFDMTVESDNYPDNYFSDLTEDSEYYRDILVATEYGLISVEAGDPIYPEDDITREFAAQTLNACLGFQLETNENGEYDYTFADFEECSFPDDDQIALNRGWFELVDSNFCPNNVVTTTEITTMLDDAKAQIEFTTVDENYDSTVELANEVVEIPNGTELTIDENGTITVMDCPVTINKGDSFTAYFYDLPNAYVAQSVTVDGNKTIIATQEANAEEVFENVDIQEVSQIDDAEFIPAEGITVEPDDSQISTFALSRDSTPVNALNNVKIGGDLTVDGWKIALSAKITNPVLETNITSNKTYVALKTDIDLSYSVSTKTSGKLDQTNKTSKAIPVGYINILGVGFFKVSFEVTLSGGITINEKFSLKMGESYTKGENLRVIADFTHKDFSIIVDATVKAGFKFELGVSVVIVKADIYASVGFAVKGTLIGYPNSTPSSCLNISGYMYLDIGAELTINLFFTSLHFGVEKAIIDSNNSPVKFAFHFEDGKKVHECTRGKTPKYLTPSDSKHSNSADGYADSYENVDSSSFRYSVSNGDATITGYTGSSSVVVIPEYIDGYKVTSIGDDAFYGCTNLTSVTIPNSVTSIDYEAFYNCTSLTSVTIGNSVTSIGLYAFYNCESLTSISIPDSVISIGSFAFSWCESLTSVTIPDSVTSIDDYAFIGCSSLTSVTIPDSVTSIGDEAFNECKSLTSITVDSGNANYSSKDGVLFNKTKTVLIQYPSGNSRPTYDIPNSVTSIGSSAFSDCESLTSVTIPDSVTSIGDHTFCDCSSLTSVTIPDSVTSIGEYAFAYCTSLTSVTIPDSVTSIAEGAFYNCTSLTSVTIPNSVTSIGDEAFRICTSLTSVIIPDSVTSIGDYAFSDCWTLTSVTIGNSVTSIGDSAFDYCFDLEDVYYCGNKTQWNKITNGSNNDDLLNAKIHYNSLPPCTNHTPATAVKENVEKATCTTLGSYDSVVYCSVCNHVINRTKKTIAKTDHTYKTTTTKATTSKNGSVVTKCTVCGAVKSKSTIYYPKTVTLSATSYTYDGKVKTPTITVKDRTDKTLVKNTDYTVSYAKGRKYVGKYAVKITFKGKYSGTKTLYFTIKPKATSISSLKAGSKKFTVKWYKRTTQTTGYQVQYSTSSKFSSPKTVTIGKTGTTSKTISKLKAKKKYYVRVRTYKTVNGTRYYSSWSKAKYVTTKS